jgi:hypothetical protein
VVVNDSPAVLRIFENECVASRNFYPLATLVIEAEGVEPGSPGQVAFAAGSEGICLNSQIIVARQSIEVRGYRLPADHPVIESGE